MALESFRGSRGSAQNHFSSKQPKGTLVKIFSGNFFVLSLKLALVLSPAFTAIIVLLHTLKYSLPIVDSVSAVTDVIFYLFFVSILFILVLIFLIMFPAFVSRQFNQSVKNSYLIYRPHPNKYSKNLLLYLFKLNLSIGGILIYLLHIYIFLSERTQEGSMLGYIFSTSATLYIVLYVFLLWALFDVYKQSRQRSHLAAKIRKIRKVNFSSRQHCWLLRFNNLVSIFWIPFIYWVWLVAYNKKEVTLPSLIFILFAPLVVAVLYNLIFGKLNETWRLLAFSLIIVLAIFQIWPGGTQLSRRVFYLLGIGGEIPVEIALLPGNKLGLREGVIKQSEPSGSIYGETLGPFRLILYGKEKIYLSTMTDQECLPEDAGSAPTNATCQRVFSIRTEYVASVDTTRSLRDGPGNSPLDAQLADAAANRTLAKECY